MLVASAAFFVFVQQAVRHAHPQAPRVQAILHEMAGCTLGIYLLHPLLLSVLSSTVEPSLLSVSPSLWILQRTVLAYFWPFFWCSWCEGYRDSADGLKFLRGIHAVSAETLKKGLA